MKRQRRLFAFSVSALAATMCAAPALAKPPRTDTIRIDVTAAIAPHCSVAATGARSNSDARLDVATSVAYGFSLDCNTPFRIGMAAQHGGLRLAGAPAGAHDLDGFAILKDYTVALSFDTDQHGVVDAGRCDASTLATAAGACAFYAAQSGEGFSPGRFTTAMHRAGTIAVGWTGEEMAGNARLAAGRYQDVLTIVVGPRT